jgi:hypothetical protein
MCLPYEKIKGYLHYYAGRFQCRRFEKWELINEAWIRIYGLENPKWASAGIRWAMQSYMLQQRQQDHRGKVGSKIRSIDEELAEGLFCKGLLTAPKDTQLQVAEDVEYAHCLLRNPNVSLADKLLIDQRYFQGLEQGQIAKIHGCAKSNISYKLSRVLRNLKSLAGAA